MSRLCTVPAWLVVVSMVLGGCGGGGADNTDTNVLDDGAGPTTVLGGTFVSTDGATPMGGALVYVERSASRDGLPPQAVSCGAPPDTSWPATCTAADGSFTLEAKLPESGATLVLARNGFEHRSSLADGRPGTIALGSVTMDPVAVGARIAVVIGDDAMQQPLARLGLGATDSARQLVYGTETFAIYDSEDGQDTTQARRTYPDWDKLFADADGDGRPDIHRYAVVVLNSGHYSKLRDNAAYRDALRGYVNAGGRVVANGLAYQLVEDLWPTYLDWDGATTAEEAPEQPVYMPSESVQWTVYGQPDIGLQAWLSAMTCTRYLVDPAQGSCFDVPANNLFAVDAVVTEVLPNFYARLLGPHAQSAGLVRTLVQGNLLIDSQVFATHPLAVVMTYGAGTVAYAAFQITPTGSLAEGMTPHERVLQYLVFER